MRIQLPFTFAQEAATTKAADPDPLVTAESDYILKDFHFVDGESLPELKLHYRTIGQPASNPSTGEVKNAVLLIHGTTGTGKQFLAKGFRDAMLRIMHNTAGVIFGWIFDGSRLFGWFVPKSRTQPDTKTVMSSGSVYRGCP